MRKLSIIIIAVIILWSNAANAQSSSNTNNWNSSRFLGWGNTSGDLPFRTNNVTRMTLQNTTGNLGIGTTSPGARLEVNGQVKITDGTQGAGKVLTSDANGLAAWQTPVSAPTGWSLTGNAGTVDGTNFLGTTNNVPLNFRVNNQKAGRIDPALFNTFYGYQSGGNPNPLYANENTAIGHSALFSNTTGDNNTATGKQSLYNNTSGYANTATGVAALYSNSTSIHNSAYGHEALYDNATGSFNTALGSWSLINNTGSSNTAVGMEALFHLSSGSNNTAVGRTAGNNNLTSTSNFTAIGYNAGHVGSNSNTIEIGNSSVAWIGGNVGWSTYSDKRIKENIQNNVPGLSFITKLNPVTYNLNTHRQNEMCGINDTNEWEGKYDIETITQTGFLAQEVEQAAKDVDYDFNGVQAPKDNAKLYSIQYSSFVVPLVKAVQELNEELKTEVGSQKAENEKLNSEIELIKAILSEEQQQKLKGLRERKSASGGSEGRVFQNSPNPFSSQTEIKFQLPSTFSSAQLIITDANGRQVRSDVLKTSSSVIIKAAELAAGTYTYSLVVDGVNVDSKQMILTK